MKHACMFLLLGTGLVWGQTGGTGDTRLIIRGGAWGEQGTPELRTWITTGESFQDTTPPIVPKYLLVLRYLSTTCTSFATPGASINCGGWFYMNETYADLKGVMMRLNYGRGAIGFGPDEVVGLWNLSDRNRVSLDSKVIERVEPRHVEETRWKERVWTVK